MVITQGDVWWADLPAPRTSGPGFRRPLLVVQGDALNATRISSVLSVPLTSNMRLVAGIGNVVLASSVTGLPKDSVANVSQVFPAERELLAERVGAIPRGKLESVLAGIDLVLGRRDA